jgi:hypothetical protein
VAGHDDADAGARALAALLRHHGTAPWGRPGDDPVEVAGLPPAVVDRLGTGVSLCMHLDGIQATTSSMIASLPRDPDEPLRAWVAPGNPCVAVFVPTFGLTGVAPELAEPTTWHRFEALRHRVDAARGVGADHAELAAVRAELGPVEGDLWDEADARAETSPEDREAWARDLWPVVDAALVRLGV